jgi:hypothetical protein
MVGFSTDQIETLKEFAAPIPYHLRSCRNWLTSCGIATAYPASGQLHRAMRAAHDQLAPPPLEP